MRSLYRYTLLRHYPTIKVVLLLDHVWTMVILLLDNSQQNGYKQYYPTISNIQGLIKGSNEY